MFYPRVSRRPGISQSEASIETRGPIRGQYRPLCGARISVASSGNPSSDSPGETLITILIKSPVMAQYQTQHESCNQTLNFEAAHNEINSKAPSDDNFKINNHFNYCQLLLIDKDPRYYFDHVYKVRLSDLKIF